MRPERQKREALPEKIAACGPESLAMRASSGENFWKSEIRTVNRLKSVASLFCTVACH
jgi:hypothetical protein